MSEFDNNTIAASENKPNTPLDFGLVDDESQLSSFEPYRVDSESIKRIERMFTDDRPPQLSRTSMPSRGWADGIDENNGFIQNNRGSMSMQLLSKRMSEDLRTEAMGSSKLRDTNLPKSPPTHTPYASNPGGRRARRRPRRSSPHRDGRRPSSVPPLPLTATIAANRARLTVSSSKEQTGLGEIYAQLDPLSLNIATNLQAQARREREQFEAEAPEVRNVVETYPTPRGGTQSRVQIKAEKLVDLEFIRRLFTEDATLADTQHLVRRLQDLLELLDRDASGFVPWESFSRVIMAVLPPNLLRADVTAFLEAQTTSPLDLVDYREFTISGKVLIVERGPPLPDKLPASSWIARQKAVAGDKSTYSWRNHVEWFRTRKARAVIWLMRRAGRAVQYYKVRHRAHDTGYIR